jgi:hypothetical protein
LVSDGGGVVGVASEGANVGGSAAEPAADPGVDAVVLTPGAMVCCVDAEPLSLPTALPAASAPPTTRTTAAADPPTRRSGDCGV